MEQFIYEIRPYFFLLTSVLALRSGMQGGTYSALMNASAMALFSISVFILHSRIKFRSGLPHRRF